MYPSNLHQFVAPGPEDPHRRADYFAAAGRHRAAGHRAAMAYPSLRDRLRAGVRVVTTRRVVAQA
jgi:hypothetical protein